MFEKIDNLRLGELFLLARDRGGNELAINCIGNKNRFAVVASNAFPAKSDIFDP